MDNGHLLPILEEDHDFQEEEEEADEYSDENDLPQNHNGNGNYVPHHQQPLQNQQHPLRIRFEYCIDRMPYSFWPFDPQHQEGNFPGGQPHQEPVQDQLPGFLENGGHILNDPPQDEKPVIQVQPPIHQEEDEDDSNFNPNDEREPQDQEPGLLQVQPIHQENGENIHNQNDDIPPPSPELHISLFEIRHLPNWPQPVREGHVPPIFSLVVPQYPVTFFIHRKYGQPGPYSTDIVTVIPLDVCNSYDDFYANARVSFQSAVGVASSNQPDENHPIPGYHLLYFFQQPAQHVLRIVGIPWEQFRNRIIVFRAFEYL